MFMSWIEIQSTECTMVVNSVIGTVMEVFPYVTLWYIVPEPMPFYMIVGSDKPQTFSIAHIERELSKRAVARSLAKIHCYQSTDIMSCYIADRADLEKNITPYLTNSDFFPVVEFCPENFICGDLGSALSFFNAVRSDSVFKHIDWTGIGDQDKTQWLAQFDKVRQAARYVIQAEHTAHPLDKLRCAMTGLAILPDYEPLIGFKRRSERMLFGTGMKHVLAEEIVEARLIADQMAQLDPDSPMPWMLRSQASQKAGDTAEALRAAQHAVKIAPDSLNAQYNLWSILVAARDLAAARAVLEDATPQ